MQWTSQQEKVIQSRKRNLLVSAAAGSGKTAVLVERIVRMITDPKNPVDLDRLLVMTFTSAAAGEMRERVGKAIEEKLAAEPGNRRLSLQAALVPHAQIQTIDSFCLSLIRSHYASLDIDPAFRVGDEGELTLLKNDVMMELFEDKYEEGSPEFVRFVETYGGGRTDMGIEEAVDQVYRFSVSHPWPMEWLSRCQEEFQEGELKRFQEKEWVQFLIRDVKLIMEEYLQQMDQAIAICQEPDGPASYLPVLLQEREMLADAASAGEFEALMKKLQALSFGRLAPARKKEIDPEKKEYVAAVRDRVKKGAIKCRDRYASQTMEEIRESMAGCSPAAKTLLELTGEFIKRYQQAKRERNLVDFGDLEHFAIQVLYTEGKPSAVADRLALGYEEILVDEYQDSNQVQETLIYALSRERFGKPDVFMVGDMKQSIYRFRQARPELFLEKYQTYSLEEGPFQKIELQKNFRSRHQVLDTVNAFFYRLMGSRLGGIAYSRENALYPAGSFGEVPAEQDNRTELFLLDTGKEELNALDEEAREYTIREMEVRLVIQQIRRLTHPETGLMIWDKHTGQSRRARYGDVVILLRSISGWAEAFVNGMMNEGIPAYAQSQTGYFDTMEIEGILSLLAVIDNPIQDIPLAAVMRSPFLGMTDQELAWMMACFKGTAEKGEDRGIYGAWRFWLEERPWEKESGEKRLQFSVIGKKLQKLDQMVSHFRRLSGILPIHQLLEKIYQDTGYYACVSAMAGGETRQANLDLLIEKASAYQRTSYQGLFHFIRYIERLKKVDRDFGEAVSAEGEEQTVQIMSIHKSKGLEFPIVILAGLGKRFNKQDAYGRLLIDPDLGIGADYVDLDNRLKAPTLKKQVLRRKLELESMGEELRVLYVAMTRAREKLIMTGADAHLDTKYKRWDIVVDEEGGLQKKKRAEWMEEGPLPFTILSSAGSYLDWILQALPDRQDLLVSRQVPAGALIGREMVLQLEKRLSRERLAGIQPGKVYDPDCHSHLEEMFNYQYPYKEEIGLYAMMSVSELKRQGQEQQEGAFPLFAQEPLEKAEEGVPETSKQREFSGGGARRGTAYHRMLQLISPADCFSLQNIRLRMEELCREGRVKKEECSMVNPKVLWNFYQSPLGKRFLEAENQGHFHRETQFMIGVPAKTIGIAQSQELVLIQGMIDAYAEEEDGLVLVDYKTDDVERAEELRERYQVQMDYYILALEQITGSRVKEAFLYSLRLQKAVLVKRTADASAGP